MMHHVQPIEVLPLFPLLDKELITLLRSLSDAQWHLPTIAKEWKVKDVAAHLLDGNLRTISIFRDKYNGEKPDNIKIYGDLVQYLNRLNADWITASKRLSPKVITDMLESSSKEYTETLSALNPFDDALFSVAWAGEEMSKNWFHVAREYTEKWIHQQQIRDAIGDSSIMTREYFHPFIATFMCALPHTYKYTDVPTGTSVEVHVTKDIGGTWHINKTDEGWVLRNETRLEPNARVEIDPDTAWRLFSKGMKPAEAVDKVRITGNVELGKVALGMVSVMA